MYRVAALLLCWICATIALAQTPFAPPPNSPGTDRLPWAKFQPSLAREVIPAFAAELEDKYVFPQTGERYAGALRRNLAAGKYDNFADVGEFAEAVTADLQAIRRDGHLLLIAPRPTTPANPPEQRGQAAEGRHGIVRSGYIARGVAYIDFADFPGDKATLSRLREFVAGHARAKTLIIDARTHHGGWILESDILLSELFARPRDLVAIDMRRSVAEKIGGLEGPTMRTVRGPPTVVRYIYFVKPSPRPAFARTRVFLLVSHATISAGEHFALALKRTHRATLIGEPTHGAGHVENDFPLPAGFFGRVPYARAYDPVTGKGWEGVGVQPDIRVPAGRALDVALKLSGVKMSSRTALARLQ